MKNIVIKNTLAEYRTYIKEHIIKNDIRYNTSFYRWLIDFVIDHRSPLFFEESFEYEKPHFTQYRNFCVLRKYDNHYLSDMYYLHDFVHMLFEYPMHVKNHTLLSFYEKLVLNEQIASNETEIETYNRLPHIRQHTFPHKIFYDTLLENNATNISFEELLWMRMIIAKMWYCKIHGKDIQDSTTEFISKFWKNNMIRSEMRYKYYPDCILERTSNTYLSLQNYDSVCEQYVSVNNEEQYQKNILVNCCNLWKLLWYTDNQLPTHFDECQQFVASIPDDSVIMKQAAHDFYYQCYAT